MIFSREQLEKILADYQNAVDAGNDQLATDIKNGQQQLLWDYGEGNHGFEPDADEAMAGFIYTFGRNDDDSYTDPGEHANEKFQQYLEDLQNQRSGRGTPPPPPPPVWTAAQLEQWARDYDALLQAHDAEIDRTGHATPEQKQAIAQFEAEHLLNLRAYASGAATFAPGAEEAFDKYLDAFDSADVGDELGQALVQADEKYNQHMQNLRGQNLPVITAAQINDAVAKMEEYIRLATANGQDSDTAQNYLNNVINNNRVGGFWDNNFQLVQDYGAGRANLEPGLNPGMFVAFVKYYGTDHYASGQSVAENPPNTDIVRAAINRLTRENATRTQITAGQIQDALATMRGYRDAVTQSGSNESQQVKDYQAAHMGDKTLVQYFNDHRKMVHDYATGETDVAPDVTAPMFQEFTDLFGREFDTNGKLKPELAPWGQAARDRFNREHPGRGREPVQNNGGDDIYRLRSQRSDTNEFMLEGITARIYHDMKIINDATFARAQQSRQDAMDVVLGVNLSEKQQKEYSVRLAIDIAHNTEMLELVPPMTLAFAYKGLKARIAKANTQEKAMLQPRLDAITARIDQLIENFARHIEYHFLDLTNIGDVHKGYEAMFAAREADLDQRRNSELIRQIGANRTRMQSFIQDFDQEWGFNGLTPADAKTLNDRYGDLAAKLADKNVSDEVMADIAKYIFYDENNQPIPQFINERTGQPSLEFIPGVTTLDPLSKLGRIIDLVRDEVTRRNLGKTPGANGAAATFQNKTAAQLQKDLDENIQFKLFSMDASEKIIGGALSDPELEAVDKFTNLEEHLTKFITEMKEGKRGVSAGTYECALDAEVNEVAGWASRAADFVGKDAEVLEKPFKAIEDIDSRATGRFEKGRADKRATKSALIKRTALNSGSAFLTSAAITTVATASSDILGLADGRMIIGGAIGGVLAITSVARSISQWKKDRKAEGKATGVKAFFKDLFKKDGGKERSLGTKLLASASAAAAMGFAMTGNVATATTLGAVAVGLGGGATAVHNYKDAVAAGHGKGFATGLGIMSAASVVLSGFAGRLAAGWGIDAYNAHNPTNTDFQTMTGSEGETTIPGADTTTIVYKPDALAGMERIERMWYNTDGPTIAKYDAMVSGTDVPRSVLSVIAGDIGVRTDDNMLLHNQWGPNVNSGGLHTVITPEVVKGWSDVDYSEIVQLKDALRAGTPLDGDLTDIVHRVAGHMNERNQIEYWGKNAAYQNDRVLGLIANRAADGSSVATAPGTGNSFITQTGLTNPGLHETITIPGEDVTTQWDDRVWTPNPQPMFTDNIPGGIGMFGVYQSSAPKQSGLRNRAGAILDRTPKRPVQTTGRGNPEGGGNPNPHGPGGGGEYWLGDPNEINDPYMDDLIRKAEEAAKEVRRRTREEQHIPVKKPDLPEVDPNIIPEKYRKIHEGKHNVQIKIYRNKQNNLFQEIAENDYALVA